MSITFRKWCGIISGIIMGLCVIATIKIGHNEIVVNLVYDKLGVAEQPPNKYVFVGTLFLFWWIWGKVTKDMHVIWINWARICFSLLMFIAMVSFILF